jgi:hypothetical protein
VPTPLYPSHWLAVFGPLVPATGLLRLVTNARQSAATQSGPLLQRLGSMVDLKPHNLNFFFISFFDYFSDFIHHRLSCCATVTWNKATVT